MFNHKIIMSNPDSYANNYKQFTEKDVVLIIVFIFLLFRVNIH